MGLNERRKIKELQDTTFPGRVKEIEEICGTLRPICADDMGKEAVRDGLKKIKLKNVEDKASMKMTFEGGVLEMNCAYAMKTDGMYSDNEIRELLVKKL